MLGYDAVGNDAGRAIGGASVDGVSEGAEAEAITSTRGMSVLISAVATARAEALTVGCWLRMTVRPWVALFGLRATVGWLSGEISSGLICKACVCDASLRSRFRSSVIACVGRELTLVHAAIAMTAAGTSVHWLIVRTIPPEASGSAAKARDCRKQE